MKKKPKRNKNMKKLQREANNLWKDIILLRDGPVCAIKKYYPHLKTKHTKVYQADHCFSQRFKRLFLEIANGTILCSGCNLNKNHNDAIRLAVYEIVAKREGDVYDRMRSEIEEAGGRFSPWRSVKWLEDKIAVLTDIKQLYQEGIL